MGDPPPSSNWRRRCSHTTSMRWGGMDGCDGAARRGTSCPPKRAHRLPPCHRAAAQQADHPSVIDVAAADALRLVTSPAFPRLRHVGGAPLADAGKRPRRDQETVSSPTPQATAAIRAAAEKQPFILAVLDAQKAAPARSPNHHHAGARPRCFPYQFLELLAERDFIGLGAQPGGTCRSRCEVTFGRHSLAGGSPSRRRSAGAGGWPRGLAQRRPGFMDTRLSGGQGIAPSSATLQGSELVRVRVVDSLLRTTWSDYSIASAADAAATAWAICASLLGNRRAPIPMATGCATADQHRSRRSRAGGGPGDRRRHHHAARAARRRQRASSGAHLRARRGRHRSILGGRARPGSGGY